MKHFHGTAGGGRKQTVFRWVFSSLVLLLWAAAIGYVSLFFAGLTMGPELRESYFADALLPFLNMLPGLLLALLMLAVTNRVWPGVLFSGVIVLGGTFAHYFKMMTRTEPLMAVDLRYISEAAGISSRYSIRPTPLMWGCIAVLADATVFAALCCRARWRRWWPRVICLVLVLAAGWSAWHWLYSSEELYDETENIDVVFADKTTLNRWSATDQFISRGFIYPFLHSATDLGAVPPKGYSRAKAEAILAEYPDEDIPEDKKVNVIAVMLEAYTDLTVYPQIWVMEEEDRNPYAFFHELQRESIRGDLITNIFAGGTIDTERNFLAASLDYYDYRAGAETYARWFGEQGYTTTFCHAGYSWFYNRKNVAEYQGFQESYFSDGWFETFCEDKIPEDDVFFPKLLDLFHERLERGKPYFNFSVTYQNHGPYPSNYFFDPYTVLVDGTNLSIENYRILTNYLHGIRKTDEALREFIGALRDDPEPVVVVLFGDHKPWLGDNSVVYDELGIDVKYRTDATFENTYRTQYVIWANNAAKKTLGNDFVGDGGDFSPAFLMLKLFDECGWTGDANMGALRELFTRFDWISSHGVYRENGVQTRWPSEEGQAMLDRYAYLQYYRMNDAMRGKSHG